MSVEFNVADHGAYAFRGFVAGLTAEVRTTKYLDAVVQFTHAKLTDSFDQWMDGVARTSPESFSHVYEWGDEYGDDETVGSPAHRLWKHVLVGKGKSRAATFAFLPSLQPTPVNPILAAKGVKEGVHVFTMKASAMEYGIDIEVTPKLAKMLAYVDDRPENSGGSDGGYHHSNPEHDAPGAIHFSEGPVTFQAGGGQFVGKFTSAFMFWWANEADDAFAREVRPRLEDGLVPRDEMGKFIARGNKKGNNFGGKTKKFGLGADASAKHKMMTEAMAAAKRNMEGKANDYIEEARIRRMMIYGV